MGLFRGVILARLWSFGVCFFSLFRGLKLYIKVFSGHCYGYSC